MRVWQVWWHALRENLFCSLDSCPGMSLDSVAPAELSRHRCAHYEALDLHSRYTKLISEYQIEADADTEFRLRSALFVCMEQQPPLRLSGLHLFFLANLLRRPVLLVADRGGSEAQAQARLGASFTDGLFLPLLCTEDQLQGATRKVLVLYALASQHYVPVVPIARPAGGANGDGLIHESCLPQHVGGGGGPAVFPFCGESSARRVREGLVRTHCETVSRPGGLFLVAGGETANTASEITTRLERQFQGLTSLSSAELNTFAEQLVACDATARGGLCPTPAGPRRDKLRDFFFSALGQVDIGRHHCAHDAYSYSDLPLVRLAGIARRAAPMVHYDCDSGSSYGDMVLQWGLLEEEAYRVLLEEADGRRIAGLAAPGRGKRKASAGNGRKVSAPRLS